MPTPVGVTLLLTGMDVTNVLRVPKNAISTRKQHPSPTQSQTHA